MESHSRMLVSPRRVTSSNDGAKTSVSAQHNTSSMPSPPRQVIYPTQFLPATAAGAIRVEDVQQQDQAHLNVSGSACGQNVSTSANMSGVGCSAANISSSSVLFSGMNAAEAANFSVFHQTLAQLYNDRFKSTVQNFWRTMSEELPLDHILLQLMMDSNTAPYVKCRVSEVVEASLMSHLNLQCHSLMGEVTKREIELQQLRSSAHQQWNETAADAHNTSSSSQQHQQQRSSRSRSPEAADDTTNSSSTNEGASGGGNRVSNVFTCTMQEYDDLMKRFSKEIDDARRTSSGNAHRAMVAEDRLTEFEREVTALQKQATKIQKEYDALAQQLQLEAKDRSVKSKALMHQVQRLLRSVDKHAERPFELVNDLCGDALAVCSLSLEYAGEDPLTAPNSTDAAFTFDDLPSCPRALKSAQPVHSSSLSSSPKGANPAASPSRAASLQAALESKRHVIDGALDEVRDATKFLQASAMEQERLLKALSESEKEVLTLRDRIEMVEGELAAARHGNVVGQELHALSSQFTKQREELDQCPKMDQVRELTSASEQRILQAISKHLQSFMHDVNEQQAAITEGLRPKLDGLTALSENMIANAEHNKSEIHESAHLRHQQRQESLSQVQGMLLSIRTDLSKHDNDGDERQSRIVSQLSGQLAEAVTAISRVIRETAEHSSAALREGLQDTQSAETRRFEQLLGEYRDLSQEQQQSPLKRFEQQLDAVMQQQQQHERSATAREELRAQLAQQQQEQHQREILGAMLTTAHERTLEVIRTHLSLLTQAYHGQQSQHMTALIDRCDTILAQHLDRLLTHANEQQEQLSQQLRNIVPSVSSAVSSLVQETTTTVLTQQQEAVTSVTKSTEEQQHRILLHQQLKQQNDTLTAELAEKDNVIAELEHRLISLKQQLDQQSVIGTQLQHERMQEERSQQQEVSRLKDDLSSAQRQIEKFVRHANSVTQQLGNALQPSLSMASCDIQIMPSIDGAEEMLKTAAYKTTEEITSLRKQNDKMKSLLQSYRRAVLNVAKSVQHEASSLKRELANVKSATQGKLQQLQTTICRDVGNVANAAFVSRHQMLSALIARMAGTVQAATLTDSNSDGENSNLVAVAHSSELLDASLTDTQLARVLSIVENNMQQKIAAFRRSTGEKHQAALRELLVQLHRKSHEESLQLLLETTESTAAAAKAVTLAMDKQAKMNEETRRMIEDRYQSETQHGEQLLERQQRLLLEQRERQMAVELQRRHTEGESETALFALTELGQEAMARLEAENRDLKSQISLQKLSFEQTVAMKDGELENLNSRLVSLNTNLLDQERRNGQLHERCSAKEKEIVRLSTLLKQQQQEHEQQQHNSSSSYLFHNPHNKSTSSVRGGSTPASFPGNSVPLRPNTGNNGRVSESSSGNDIENGTSPNPNPFMSLLGSGPSSSRSPTREPTSSSSPNQLYYETLAHLKPPQEQHQQQQLSTSAGVMDVSRDSARHFHQHDQSSASMS